jgi:hypothetical protein
MVYFDSMGSLLPKPKPWSSTDHALLDVFKTAPGSTTGDEDDAVFMSVSFDPT